jgi:hypothetical protein
MDNCARVCVCTGSFDIKMDTMGEKKEREIIDTEDLRERSRENHITRACAQW